MVAGRVVAACRVEAMREMERERVEGMAKGEVKEVEKVTDTAAALAVVA